MQAFVRLSTLKAVVRTENGVPGEAIAEAFHNFEQGSTGMSPMTAAAISNQTIQESMRLLLLVRAYQVGQQA